MVKLISKKISINKQEIINIFNNTSDLITYEFETKSNIKMMVCYIEGFIDRNLLDRDILKPIILNLETPKDIKKVIYVSSMEEIELMEEIADKMTYGNVAIFVNGINKSYIINLNQWEKGQ